MKNKKDAPVTGRTLYYFGRATLGHWPYFLLDFLTSTGYAYFLTFGNRSFLFSDLPSLP